MTVRNREKSSPDWGVIRRRYEEETLAIRALAREHHTSDTEIRRRAIAGAWVRFSASPAVQQGVQQVQETERPWHFDPRRDALVEALKRSRHGVETVEDSIYCDLKVVMALLWLRAPLADIAKAIELTEVQLEALYGPAIIGFIRQFYGATPEDRQARHRDKSRRAA
jgi:hypothetical protein